MGKYFDRIDRKWYEEKDLRKVYFDYEIQSIKDDYNDFIDNFYDIQGACDYIKLAINGPIQTIVDKLNCNWNYELISEEKYYMDQYTSLSSKVGELEEQLEETKNQIEKVQFNLHRLAKEEE
jgi:archaellum component FlaC